MDTAHTDKNITGIHSDGTFKEVQNIPWCASPVGTLNFQLEHDL